MGAPGGARPRAGCDRPRDAASTRYERSSGRVARGGGSGKLCGSPRRAGGFGGSSDRWRSRTILARPLASGRAACAPMFLDEVSVAGAVSITRTSRAVPRRRGARRARSYNGARVDRWGNRWEAPGARKAERSKSQHFPPAVAGARAFPPTRARGLHAAHELPRGDATGCASSAGGAPRRLSAHILVSPWRRRESSSTSASPRRARSRGRRDAPAGVRKREAPVHGARSKDWVVRPVDRRARRLGNGARRCTA